MKKEKVKKEVALAGGGETWERGLTSPLGEGVDGLPEGWVKCPTSDVATLIRGVTYTKNDAHKSAKNGLKPILRANNINGTINFDDLVFLPENLISPDQHLRAGDILFAMSSGSLHLVGKSARIQKDIEAGFGAFCGVLRPKEGVSAAYLFHVYQTNTFRNAISKISKGSNINNLKREHLLEYVIPLPPLNEQRRIVAKIEELFSELDAGEENLRLARKQLGVYRQALLKQAFEGRLTEGWRGRNAWRMTTLGEVLTDISSGKSFQCEGRPPTAKEFGVAKVSAVTWGVYDELESKACHDPAKFESRYLVQPGDFLFSRANTIELVGACVIAQKVTLKVMLSDKLLRFKFSSAANPRWILYCLQSSPCRREIERLSTGNQMSMRNIGQGRIRQIPIPLPSLSEQEEIVRILAEQFEAIEQNEREIDAALVRSSALRQSILKQAFVGKLQFLSNPGDTK